MEEYAKKLATDYKVNSYASKKNFPREKIKENFNIITKAYKLLTESIEKHVPISLAGEWLLDNYYIIEEQTFYILHSLNKKTYKKLPAVNGVPRISLICEEFVKYNDGYISKENIERFFNAYQTKDILVQAELYELELYLQIALINKIKNVSEKIIRNQLQKFKVESLIERNIKKNKLENQKFYEYKDIKLKNEVGSYVEYLFYKLKKMGRKSKRYLEILEEEISKTGTTSDKIIKSMHFEMTLQRVSISSSILSLKRLTRLNFNVIVENINFVEKILMQDEIYLKLDDDTKEIYRNEIKGISQKLNVSEIYIAQNLIEFIKTQAELDMSEILLGDKKIFFLKQLGYKENLKDIFTRSVLKHKLFLYLTVIYLPTFLISFEISKTVWPILFIPISEVFVSIINKIIIKKVKPQILPRLKEIDENVNTFVIVPTLLKSAKRVEELFESMEKYYILNKMDGLYFCLLGDASEEKEETVKHDEIVILKGKSEAERLNKKYGKDIFYFAYRKRIYNEKQESYLGYERKRGMINEFNNFLLYKDDGTFIVNTLKNAEIPNIKYIITLDADTEMNYESARKLIGTMEHPFNRPVIKKGIVSKGYGLIQPKIGVSLESSNASTFSKLFAGVGGIDIYSTAESDVYQDLFGEGIFTGKGIYNLNIFDQVLKNEIPDNKVLSHDLLEGSYLRVGLASDIKLIDGFPSKVNSYLVRQARWTRGDWQVSPWLFNQKINALSKYKILDNLRRSLIEPCLLIEFFLGYYYMPIILAFAPLVIGIRKRYFQSTNELKNTFLNCLVNFILLPYKAVILAKSILVTLYRMIFTKKHLLDWVTAADAETSLQNTLASYARQMIISPVIGFILVASTFLYNPITFIQAYILFLIWYSAPFVAYIISKNDKNSKICLEEISEKELVDIAKRTWNFFDEYISKENNYLMPDNFDNQRKEKITRYTSSTNIGLSMVAIISAYNLKFIDEKACVDRLKNIVEKIEQLKKWNGHLYNWYDIKNLDTIKPEFISTVDSGNFVGYLYTVLGFLKTSKYDSDNMLKTKIEKLIRETDFTKLYDYDKNIFSIGFDINQNKLVDSYYDLMASEARLASFVAIAKGDVSYKHWFYLGRSYTKLNNRSGLISWSGTMFEYLMPNVIMKLYKNSLLENAIQFALYSQIKYASKLEIPWGISESAFSVRDMKYNYQYQAFGIPWLGLKRGIEEDVVVSPYSSIISIEFEKEKVLDNIEYLKELGGYGKYGFYESIDFTPSRMEDKKYEVVKTYMAHHQALILLSLNNFLNDKILKKYFLDNIQIESAQILLQEKNQEFPNYIKIRKENVKKLKYKDYQDSSTAVINNSDKNVNILSNDEHTLLITSDGDGYSQNNEIYLYKFNDNQRTGNVTYIKNVDENVYWSNTKNPCTKEPDEYQVEFSTSDSFFYRKDGNLETYTTIYISPEDNLEIRKIELRNMSEKNTLINVINYFDPILSEIKADIVHPAYNKLFFTMQEYNGNIIVEKRFRNGEKNYLTSFAITENSGITFDYESDKSEIIGRCRSIENPIILTENKILSNNIAENTDLAIATKAQFILTGNGSVEIYYCVGFDKDLEKIKKIIDKYKSKNMLERTLEMAKSRATIENRFYKLNYNQILTYNKLLYEMLNGSGFREKYQDLISKNQKSQSDIWKYGISGDLPIILIKIKKINDVYVVRELIDAVRYFRLKNIFVDLVIIDEEKDEKYIYENILRYIELKNISYLIGTNAGIHIILKEKISQEEEYLFYDMADIILNAERGFIKDQLGGENEK